MPLLNCLLFGAGIGMFVIAAGILTYDAYSFITYRRGRLHPECALSAPPPVSRRRTAIALVMLAWAPLLISVAIVVFAGITGVQS